MHYLNAICQCDPIGRPKAKMQVAYFCDTGKHFDTSIISILSSYTVAMRAHSIRSFDVCVCIDCVFGSISDIINGRTTG